MKSYTGINTVIHWSPGQTGRTMLGLLACCNQGTRLWGAVGWLVTNLGPVR